MDKHYNCDGRNVKVGKEAGGDNKKIFCLKYSM